MKQCMDSENLHRRLKKIIGQVQAIDRMIDEDIPCEDVLARSTLPNQRCTKPGRWFWRGISDTVSGMGSNTATPTRRLRTLPRP